jgi:hypothetical protein
VGEEEIREESKLHHQASKATVHHADIKDQQNLGITFRGRDGMEKASGDSTDILRISQAGPRLAETETMSRFQAGDD